MRTVILTVVLMIGLTSLGQKGMSEYASVDFKPNGNVKVFVKTFKTYVYNVDFIEDAMIFDTEIELLMNEYYRILDANYISVKRKNMNELFDMINKDGYISIVNEKNCIEYFVTIQDTSGEIIVITHQ